MKPLEVGKFARSKRIGDRGAFVGVVQSRLPARPMCLRTNHGVLEVGRSIPNFVVIDAAGEGWVRDTSEIVRCNGPARELEQVPERRAA